MAPSPPRTRARSALRLPRSFSCSKSKTTISQCFSSSGSRRSASSRTPGRYALPRTKIRIGVVSGQWSVAGSLEAAGGGQLTADAITNAVNIQAEVCEKLRALGVLDEAVGEAEADDVFRLQSGGVGGFQKGAAEAALKRAFLHGDDERQLLDRPQQSLFVERLGEA